MMGHTPQSLRDSSPNLGEQPEIQIVGGNDRGSHSSPKLGEVPQRGGGVCLPICLLLLLLVSCLLPQQAWSQKYACVNTDYILKNIPDYVTAMNKLAKFTEEWQTELAGKQQEVDELREQYQQEAYLLPDNLKQRRQDEIRTKDSELRALQRQRFGAGGDLDKKRAELLKPVQDRVYATIERVAHEKNYAFVFDKAGSATVLFASKKYDISDEVLEMLGYKPGAASGEAEGKEAGKKPTNPEMRPADKSRERSNPMREIDRSKNKQ